MEFNRGGKTKEPENFTEIRIPTLWNTQFIKFMGKTLVYKHWIKCGLIYVNEWGYIRNIILDKFIYIANRQSEICTVKIEWKKILKDESSIKSKISIKNDNEK